MKINIFFEDLQKSNLKISLDKFTIREFSFDFKAESEENGSINKRNEVMSKICRQIQHFEYEL